MRSRRRAPPWPSLNKRWVEQKLLRTRGERRRSCRRRPVKQPRPTQLSIAKSIGSPCAFIGAMDWKNTFRILRSSNRSWGEDPAECMRPGFRPPATPVPAMSSRMCPEGVSRPVSRRAGREAISLARRCRAASGRWPDRTAHVGYYLLVHGGLSGTRSVGCRLLP